ncbi:MAG: class I SAM-dependent rRNA methyltransferase [Candidatus Zixiibacteriota bacterium]
MTTNMDNLAGRLVLKPKEDRRIRAGHLWIFSNEIAEMRGVDANGDLVDVFRAEGQFVGRAYYNRNTLIAARLLSRHDDEINTAFFVKHFRKAKEYRESVMGDIRSGRLIYSEGDLLPGLIVDRYEDWLVVQIFTAGMERLRDFIIESLIEVYAPKGILLRNDTSYRELEGLLSGVEIVFGEVPLRITIEEAGVRFVVDPYEGHKTGFYFDQRDTRTAARKIAPGRKVLDCFSYTGGFAVNYALGGASSVLAIDESESVLSLLDENSRLNGVENIITFERANCFERLRKLALDGERFDLITLDPPAFVKSKSKLKTAISGYREINMTAMKLLSPGGILVTCSCSMNLTDEAFQSLLRTAARDARRGFRIRSFITQSADHPILQAMPETQYLRCYILEAI